jgi:hypothetical protein
VAHAFDEVEPRVGYCLCCIEPTGQRDQRIGIAVDNQCRDRHGAQRFPAAWSGNNCRKLTREPRWVHASLERILRHAACSLLFERKTRAAQGA